MASKESSKEVTNKAGAQLEPTPLWKKVLSMGIIAGVGGVIFKSLLTNKVLDLLDMNVVQLLLAAVVSMIVCGALGMAFANSEFRPAPDDVTEKKHFLTVLAIGMLGAALGGMMFYPFIVAAKDPIARAGLDAFWTICKSVGASGFALLTGVPMASFLDKLVDRKRVSDDK